MKTKANPKIKKPNPLNWFDYTRGYDDGYYSSGKSKAAGGPFLAFLRRIFSALHLSLKIIFYLLKRFAVLLWTIFKWLARGNR